MRRHFQEMSAACWCLVEMDCEGSPALVLTYVMAADVHYPSKSGNRHFSHGLSACPSAFIMHSVITLFVVYAIRLG